MAIQFDCPWLAAQLFASSSGARGCARVWATRAHRALRRRRVAGGWPTPWSAARHGCGRRAGIHAGSSAEGWRWKKGYTILITISNRYHRSSPYQNIGIGFQMVRYYWFSKTISTDQKKAPIKVGTFWKFLENMKMKKNHNRKKKKIVFIHNETNEKFVIKPILFKFFSVLLNISKNNNYFSPRVNNTNNLNFKN